MCVGKFLICVLLPTISSASPSLFRLTEIFCLLICTTYLFQWGSKVAYNIPPPTCYPHDNPVRLGSAETS